MLSFFLGLISFTGMTFVLGYSVAGSAVNQSRPLKSFPGFLVPLWMASLFFVLGFSLDGRPYLKTVLAVLQSLFGLIYCLKSPEFFYSLLGIPYGKKQKFWAALYTVIFFIFVVLQFLFQADWNQDILAVLFYGVIGFEIVFSLFQLRVLRDKAIRKAFAIFLGISLAFFPFFLADTLLATLLHVPDGFYAQPLYFIVLCVLFLIFVKKILNRAPSMKDGKLTADFCESYKISPREAEVAAALAQGKTQKEIAAEFFISPKTVENHVGRIYQKLGVRNRVEMTRLILSRASDSQILRS